MAGWRLGGLDVTSRFGLRRNILEERSHVSEPSDGPCGSGDNRGCGARPALFPVLVERQQAGSVCRPNDGLAQLDRAGADGVSPRHGSRRWENGGGGSGERKLWQMDVQIR